MRLPSWLSKVLVLVLVVLVLVGGYSWLRQAGWLHVAAVRVLASCKGSTGRQMGLSGLQMTSETTGWAWNYDGPDLLRTTDGGCHWRRVKSWPVQEYGLSLSSFLSDRVAWVATSKSRLFRTTDGGQSWSSWALPPASKEVYGSIKYGPMNFLTQNLGWMLVLNFYEVRPTSASTSAITTGVDVYRTSDGGQHWTKLTSSVKSTRPAPGKLPDNAYFSSLGFLDASTGWIGGPAVGEQGWLYVTHDGGQSWYPQTLPTVPGVGSLRTMVTFAPHFSSARDGVLAATFGTEEMRFPQGFSTFVTHDGGASWRATPLLEVDYTHLVMGSLQAGSVYLQVPPPVFVDSSFGWDDAGVLTNDSGRHWSQFAAGLPKQPSQVDFVSSQVGWALIYDVPPQLAVGGVPSHLYKTTDGGKTWQQVVYSAGR